MTKEALLQDGLLSVREACKFLSMSRSKVWEMMDQGDIPFVYAKGYGNAARRIPKAALVAWAAERLLGT